jgi:predicted  nucleic acid-binding Zn-ribbon protein
MEETQMTNLKTKEEMYFDYSEAIEFLENEVNSLESLISRTEVEIAHKNDRIEKLKETAEMYAPKQKQFFNTNITVDNENFDVEAFKRGLDLSKANKKLK